MRKLSAARPETLRTPHDNTPSPGNPPPRTRQPSTTSTTTLRPRQPSATNTATLRSQPPQPAGHDDPPKPRRRAPTPYRPGSHPTASITPKPSVTPELSALRATSLPDHQAPPPGHGDPPPRARRVSVISTAEHAHRVVYRAARRGDQDDLGGPLTISVLPSGLAHSTQIGPPGRDGTAGAVAF